MEHCLCSVDWWPSDPGATLQAHIINICKQLSPRLHHNEIEISHTEIWDTGSGMRTLRHTLHRHLSTSQNKHSDLACSSHVYTRMQQDFSRVNINVKMMIVVPWNKTAQVSGVVFLLPDGGLRQSSLCWSCSSWGWCLVLTYPGLVCCFVLCSGHSPPHALSDQKMMLCPAVQLARPHISSEIEMFQFPSSGDPGATQDNVSQHSLSRARVCLRVRI